MKTLLFKLTCIHGLSDIVAREIAQYPQYSVVQKAPDSVYIETRSDLKKLLNLRSVLQVYLISQDAQYHPLFISKHKSVLGEMIETALNTSPNKFTSFSMSCAGSDSAEVRRIIAYITDHFKLVYQPDEADIKIYIGKNGTMWELGVSMSPRPLSDRDYKTHHIPGGINPSIAYAMNSLCNLSNAKNYLNIFSGSATLPIEAALQYPNIVYTGIENNKETTSKSIHNIRTAGLIKNISITYADIYDNPELGIFDVITADVPFGMQIGKNSDITKLYTHFLTYSEKHLHDTGTLIIYTSETDIMRTCLKNSVFHIDREIPLKLITSVNSYLYPSIFVCKKKQ
jgi:16S rRNA G966 N2-methylase RsmD